MCKVGVERALERQFRIVLEAELWRISVTLPEKVDCTLETNSVTLVFYFSYNTLTSSTVGIHYMCMRVVTCIMSEVIDESQQHSQSLSMSKFLPLKQEHTEK